MSFLSTTQHYIHYETTISMSRIKIPSTQHYNFATLWMILRKKSYLLRSRATLACSCFSSQLISWGTALHVISGPSKSLEMNGSTPETFGFCGSKGTGNWLKEAFGVSKESYSPFGWNNCNAPRKHIKLIGQTERLQKIKYIPVWFNAMMQPLGEMSILKTPPVSWWKKWILFSVIWIRSVEWNEKFPSRLANPIHPDFPRTYNRIYLVKSFSKIIKFNKKKPLL